MARIKMLRDVNGYPSYVWPIVDIINDTTSSSSKRISVGANKVIEVCCSEDCYINIGNDTVTVSPSSGKRIFLSRGVYFSLFMGDNTHIAHIQVSAAGNLCIIVRSEVS